ncbi:BLUF domain-containing protein [Acidiphilium sp. PA]|uniref:BLUF domain-containing protein n=2 Tax=Acidiphilium TaxID=522 RepID=UPI002243E014|nr:MULTISPECIES: BLUF domain-containing protein [unclassified Acidiphilium]MCW8309333.1 BLUF domain-containing protein [Acidiphilium sp. PA]
MIMKNNFYRAVYCSRCELIGSPETITAELQSILATSRRNNRPAGLTGALLFANNCFAQTLEGEREAVERCFERIQIDPRHSDVTVLEFGPAVERDFTEWSMAFVGDPSATSPDPLAVALFKDIFADNHADSGAKVLLLLRQLVHQEDLWAIA